MLQNKFYRGNILLLGILSLALILRIINLGSNSLWLDEAVNVKMAEKSFFQWTFVVPPLYNIILHPVLTVGKSEAIVRFPSVIFGVLSVFAIYKVGLILYGKKEALISAFLLSISPVAIFYSQETTYYSLVFFLSLVSIYFFLRVDEKPTNLNKVLFLISLALTFYAHYFTIILLFVFIMFKIWVYKRDHKDIKEIKSFSILVGMFFLLIAPMLLNYLFTPFKNAGTSFIMFENQTNFSVDFVEKIIDFLIKGVIYRQDSILPFLIMGLVLYGFFSSLDYFENSITFLTFWLFLPLGFAAILTPYIANLQIRYLLFILPALLLISSHGIITIPDGINYLLKKIRIKPIKLNLLVIILILIIIALSYYPILNIFYNQYKNYQWRETAEFLQSNAENGSNIVLIPGYNNIPFSYYYKANSRVNVAEYSTFDEFIKLTHKNNTYLVVTGDVYALNPVEVKKLKDWAGNNMKLEAAFSSINVLKTREIVKDD